VLGRATEAGGAARLLWRLPSGVARDEQVNAVVDWEGTVVSEVSGVSSALMRRNIFRVSLRLNLE
jgi:hypothetical protein